MKSVAAYYVLIAMNGQELDADRRHHELAAAAARPPRPSIVSRVRALIASPRASGPASNPA
jgi:hypothetical protein